MRKVSLLSSLLVVAAAILPPGSACAQEKLSPEQVKALARDAYNYAFPIVLMDITMRQATNVPNAATIPMRAPVNQFAHARAYPKADEKDVVRFNFDTLYSLAWIDVSGEPMVLSVPDTGGRYYLLPMLDMWSDVFAVVGSRTTGTKAGHFAVVAPGWSATLPQGIDRIVAPTPLFWIIGRTQTNGPADYANVHKIQDGYKLTPLSQWGKGYTPPPNAAIDSAVDNKTPPKEQMERLDGVTVLSRLASLFSKYPPHPNDYPMLFRLRALGIEPGKPFDPSTLDATTVASINAAGKEALEGLAQSSKRIGKLVNGWNVVTENIGAYGTSYQQRADVALIGLGANLPEDAVYPTAFVDEAGQPPNGANKYVLHFDKGKLPPANAFWSITMYDDKGFQVPFQVPNAVNRFALGDRDKLTFNADGSLDLYLQADSPGKEKEANWLPAPKGVFAPTMRIYSPRAEVMDGTWPPPPLKLREGIGARALQ
jgi:hypothetical protein